jgi:hypothetical protein
MQPELQPEEMRLYRLCDEALYYVWDPLGASGAPESRDEYRAYVRQVYELVRWGKRDELIAYLTSVLRVRLPGRARGTDVEEPRGRVGSRWRLFPGAQPRSI